MAGVLQPLSGKVKIMMNRSIVDGSPRLLFEYQANLPVIFFEVLFYFIMNGFRSFYRNVAESTSQGSKKVISWFKNNIFLTDLFVCTAL
jgi:hypothetical protein